MSRPYTRSLHPSDYAFLPHADRLRQFVDSMGALGIPHRGWHEHRLWEYASIMQQLEELEVPKDAAILDVGSGGSFFPPYLATVGGYPNVSLTDSMRAGDISGRVAAQRLHYGLNLPLYRIPAEDMSARPEQGWRGQSNSWDVVMCISTIEHVDADKHDAALREIHRLTQPGGLIFITSDYFHSSEQHQASPWRDDQCTPYNQWFVDSIPRRIAADFVGETDLEYRGDFVHNYSFVNICLRKRHV